LLTNLKARLAAPRWVSNRLLGAGFFALCGVAIAYETASGKWLEVLGLVAVSAALAVGIYNWRVSVYGLLLYLPFSGLPSILTYPNTQGAVLLKDVFFVIPAYIGFALTARRRGWSYPGAPVMLIGALALLVLVQAFNPAVPNPLVALIGIKVWLLYIPLMFLGYHLVSSRPALTRLFGLMAIAAVTPAVIGVIEALLIYGGQSKFVYSFYGQSVSAVTQSFEQTFYVGGGTSVRVSGIFAFVTQYFALTASMVGITLAWRALSRRRYVGAVIWCLMLLASFTSGARGAFIMVPLLVLMTLVLQRRMATGVVASLTVVIVFLAAANIFGAQPTEVFRTASGLGMSEVQSGFVTGVQNALQITTTGLGTGTISNQSRYAFSNGYNPSSALAGSESWWVKVMLEFGLVGLAIVLALFGWMITTGWRAYLATRDPDLKVAAGALLAFFVWNLVYMTKGSYIDLDPINVYFWLFAGILVRIPQLALARTAPAQASPAMASGHLVHSTPSRSLVS
jgi:hypothetical protein